MLRRAADPEAHALAGSRSKADRIYLALRRDIVSGELPPGGALDKPALCDRFGVSRLPVTTAINRLAYERLVLIEPQRGSYVAKIRLDDVLQWMLARRALEAEVAAEAARRLSAQTVDRLERNLLYQQAAIGGEDFAGFLELDVAFHKLFPDGLALHRVAELLESLRGHLDRIRRLLLPEPGRMDSTLAEHRAILDAVTRRRPRQAEAAMRAHVDSVRDRLIAFEKAHPNLFD
jgi:DNA-binding GntR family transcriptional regulator